MRRKKLTRRALKEGKPADYYLNPRVRQTAPTETEEDGEAALAEATPRQKRKAKKSAKK